MWKRPEPQFLDPKPGFKGCFDMGLASEFPGQQGAELIVEFNPHFPFLEA